MANVNSRKYWLRVRREAFTRAWRLIVGSTVTLFFAAVSVGSLVIGLSVFGSPDAALDEVVGRSVLAFAGFLFFLGVYLYFEHKIPAEWDSEKQGNHPVNTAECWFSAIAAVRVSRRFPSGP